VIVALDAYWWGRSMTAMNDDFVMRVKRDPDGTWHELRRRAFPFGRQVIAVAFGKVLHDPHPERRRIIVSVSAPARRIVVPRRYLVAEDVEEVCVVWGCGAASVPARDVGVRGWSQTHVLLELPPLMEQS
jgi:hypothetical protein